MTFHIMDSIFVICFEETRHYKENPNYRKLIITYINNLKTNLSSTVKHMTFRLIETRFSSAL